MNGRHGSADGGHGEGGRVDGRQPRRQGTTSSVKANMT